MKIILTKDLIMVEKIEGDVVHMRTDTNRVEELRVGDALQLNDFIVVDLPSLLYYWFTGKALMVNSASKKAQESHKVI